MKSERAGEAQVMKFSPHAKMKQKKTGGSA